MEKKLDMPSNSNQSNSLNYAVSKKTKLVLMSLLIILNIVLRIPSIPHEKGYDSFFIHSLANTISYFGEARWWINWMSVFGMYPYSYSSAVPFSLSGISQLTDISMEKTILLFCIFLGVFSIFVSYSLSSVFYEDFISRLMFSFIFSISSGTMRYTTWEITTRAQFLVFFPLLIYALLKLLHSEKRFVIVLVPSIIFMFATHHYVYIAILFLALLLIVFLFYQYGSKIRIKSYQGYSFDENFVYLLGLLLILVAPFFLRDKLGLIEAGSRYSWIISMITQSIRNLGIMFPFSIGGAAYLSLKRKKGFEEWCILICLLPTVMFAYNQIYGYLISYLFMAIISTQGIIVLIENYIGSKKRFILAFLAIVLILNSSFSGFFNHWHLGMGGGSSEWYMREVSYVNGEWVKQNINHDKVAIYSGYESTRMASSYGDFPMVFRDDTLNYIFSLIDLDESNIEKVPMSSLNFYFDNPYVLKSGSSSTGSLSWILNFPVTQPGPQTFIETYNVSYFFQDTIGYGSDKKVFVTSLESKKNKISDSGRIKLWIL